MAFVNIHCLEIFRRATWLCIAVFVSLISVVLQGQEPLKIGGWSSHLPLNRGAFVTQTPESVIYVSDQSLLILNKETGSRSILSKTNGLNDVGVKFAKYFQPLDILAIVYENSNIDLVIQGRIRNFNQIRNNLNIVGDKTVFDVSFNQEGSLFLSCGFGLVELNLQHQEFGVTTFTPVAVNDFAQLGDYYFMATQEGLYRANIITSTNLADFGQWEYLDEAFGLPSGLSIQEAVSRDNQLYIGMGSSLYVTSDGNTFELLSDRPGYSIQFLSSETQDLSIGWNCNSCKNEVQILKSDGSFEWLDGFCVDNPRFAVQDQFGSIWLADQTSPFRVIRNGSEGFCERIEFNAIYSSNVSDMVVRGDNLFVASGGFQSNSSNLFREDGFFAFDGSEWSFYNKFNVPVFAQRDIRDFLRLQLHPTRDTLFVGIYYDGLLKWVDQDNFVIYDETNSTLRRGVGDPNRIRIAGMDWDSKGNLWLGQFDSERPASVYRNDGTWRSFSVPGSINLMDLVVDRFDNKWYRVFNGGILVFNEGQNMDDQSDFRFRSITTSNSLLPANSVTCLVMDLEGAVWVGTENGILIMECGSDPFRPECRGSERFLEQDGSGEILLSGQIITTIAVDGANRKWIGTTAGLFVQSPAGDEPVYNFTSTNSPLLDNNITAITVDDATGKIYIATNRGIQIFKAEATRAGASFRSDVYAYPNPVRPDYDGPIAIKGLARDANFKITDVEGRLVFEGIALGGQAIWDGRDFSGRQVSTGVYLVFATYTRNEEFPQTHVTKLMIVR